jgi:hypothetical protein
MTQAGLEKLLALVHIALSAAGLVVGGFVCLGLAQSEEPNAEAALGIVLWVFIVAQVFWLLPGLIGGLGLLWGQGWARRMIAMVSAVLLLLFPVGTVLGAGGLWVLLGRPANAQLRAAPKALGRGQGFALCAIAAAGCLGLMIGLGYLLRDLTEKTPPLPDRRVIAAAIGMLAVAAVAFTGIAARRGLGPSLIPALSLRVMRARAEQSRVVAEHKARLARLSADPLRAKYVAKIQAGDYWSDEQIAYELDSDRTSSCEHLAGIERAMRRAGVVLKPLYASPLHVEARCMIDARRFEAIERPACVHYLGDHHITERFGDHVPDPLVSCALCNSALHTAAPEAAKPGMPTFP